MHACKPADTLCTFSHICGILSSFDRFLNPCKIQTVSTMPWLHNLFVKTAGVALNKARNNNNNSMKPESMNSSLISDALLRRLSLPLQVFHTNNSQSACPKKFSRVNVVWRFLPPVSRRSSSRASMSSWSLELGSLPSSPTNSTPRLGRQLKTLKMSLHLMWWLR